MKTLTAIPVYNEERHLGLRRGPASSPDILVINDGSTDATGELLTLQSAVGLNVVTTHPQRLRLGPISAFEYFAASDFDVLVTMDCDGQHEPNPDSGAARGPRFRTPTSSAAAGICASSATESADAEWIGSRSTRS